MDIKEIETLFHVSSFIISVVFILDQILLLCTKATIIVASVLSQRTSLLFFFFLYSLSKLYLPEFPPHSS